MSLLRPSRLCFLVLRGRLKVIIDELGNVVIRVIITPTGTTHVGAAAHLPRDPLEVLKIVGSQLVDDAREEVLKLLVLRRAADHVRVGANARLFRLWSQRLDLARVCSLTFLIFATLQSSAGAQAGLGH